MNCSRFPALTTKYLNLTQSLMYFACQYVNAIEVLIFHYTTDVEVKLLWFTKVLEPIGSTESTTDPLMSSYFNVCTALDLLAFLLQVLPQQVVLNGFRGLHKGVGMCMTCGNTKVVRFVHGLITKLVTMFPTDLGKG